MSSRFIRLGMVAAALLAMLGSMTPAHAISARVSAFVGSVTLAAPIGFPCTGTKTTPLLTKCTITPSIHLSLPLPTDIPNPGTNFHVHPGGNTIPVVAASAATCADVGVNITKAGKAPAHAGTCTFSLLPSPKNHVNGYCGIAGGQIVVTTTDALGQAWTTDIHFTGIGPIIYLTGHATKVSSGQTGLFLGAVAAAPVPVVLPTPTVTPLHVTNNSCSTKTATVFTIAGTASWVAT